MCDKPHCQSFGRWCRDFCDDFVNKHDQVYAYELIPCKISCFSLVTACCVRPAGSDNNYRESKNLHTISPNDKISTRIPPYISTEAPITTSVKTPEKFHAHGDTTESKGTDSQ